MGTLHRALFLLVAIGLLAAPRVAAAAGLGDAGAQAWGGARQELAPLASDAAPELVRTKASEEADPPSASGDSPPPAARAGAELELRACSRAALAAPRPRADDRVLLAQAHRRVNGAADAHGARA